MRDIGPGPPNYWNMLVSGPKLRHGFDFSEFVQYQGVVRRTGGILSKDKPAESGQILTNPEGGPEFRVGH